MLQRVVVTNYNELDDCELQTFAARPPGFGELQVEVHAAGVAFADTIMCCGLYQVRPEPPFALGSESAGIVSAVGSGVEGFNVGDRVGIVGFVSDRIHGAFSQSITVPVDNAMLLPDQMSFVEAAAFRSSYETARYAFLRGELRAGETLLILGAGGGLGIAAVQMGKMLGARIIASATGRTSEIWRKAMVLTPRSTVAQRTGASRSMCSREEKGSMWFSTRSAAIIPSARSGRLAIAADM